MAELKKSVGLPEELTAEILISGWHTLEQGELEIVKRLSKKGLENLIAQKVVSNRVAWLFKQLNKKIEKEEEEKKMKNKKMEREYKKVAEQYPASMDAGYSYEGGYPPEVMEKVALAIKSREAVIDGLRKVEDRLRERANKVFDGAPTRLKNFLHGFTCAGSFDNIREELENARWAPGRTKPSDLFEACYWLRQADGSADFINYNLRAAARVLFYATKNKKELFWY
ncbi:MAG: hypothetical protein Q7R92_04800 [bacterium]|nr:hypothetical protein [bacterium]